MLDATDKKILTLLQENGRITNARLAQEVGLSPPAVLERVRRLESSGIQKVKTSFILETLKNSTALKLMAS
ncbi:Lrp/AsnC family transcriptional regulator [Desulfocastanea catecholica]